MASQSEETSAVDYGHRPDMSKFDQYFIMANEEETPSIDLTKGSPAAPVVAPPDQIAEKSPVAQTAKEGEIEQPVKEEPKVEDKKEELSPLALKIKADREARAARQQAKTPVADDNEWKVRAEKAETQLASLSKLDVVQDAKAWADAMGMTPEEVAFVGEQLLYSLAPHKADAEVRVRMMEAKQARRARLEETSAKQRALAQQQAQVQEMHNNYVAALEHSVANLRAGTYPESETWYGDDHESYVGALYTKANRMAEEARQAGQMADLTFSAVARKLEEDFVSRLSRRKTAASPSKAEPVPAPKPVATQPVASGKTISASELNVGGAPRQPARTDAERIKRASEVVW